jgi:outer membrane protein assembly factor BamB
LCGQRAIFGSRDGCVYSLRASDGALAWRLQAGRDDRRIVAHGQLESASPVHGSVLIRRGAAYVTAGRSSYLDGGIDLCRIEPHSGKLLSRTPIFSPAPKSGKQPPHDGPGNMPGALSDILASDDEHVYLRDMAFGLDGRSQTAGKPHLLTLTGFLDDTWPHRSYWIFGTSCSLATGCTRREKDLVYGRLLAFNAATIYGYGRQNVHWSNQLQDGPYRVFAVNRADGVLRWEKPVPIQVRAMVLAGNVLFVAGPPVESADPAKGPDAREGTLLLALSTTHGAELARCPLAAPPVFDGIGAANRRLYLSATDGTLVCLAANESVGENP